MGGKNYFSFIKKLGDYTSPMQKYTKVYKCLRREGVDTVFLLALLLVFLLFFLLFLKLLGINFYLKDVEVGIEMAELPLTEVKTLTKIF